MKNKLAIAIRAVNLAKTSSVKSRPFTVMCKDMDANHETLSFHSAVRWLSKENMIVRVYQLRKEVELYFEAQENQNFLHLSTADGF